MDTSIFKLLDNRRFWKYSQLFL